MRSKWKKGPDLRSPYSGWLRAHGHKVVRDKTKYRRKAKHKKVPRWSQSPAGLSLPEKGQVSVTRPREVTRSV